MQSDTEQSLNDCLIDTVPGRPARLKLFREHMEMLNSAGSIEDIKPLIQYLLEQELQIL